MRLIALFLATTALTSFSVGENKSEQAAALIAHARQVSDIRAEGSPPFHLKATIKIIADDGVANEGSYEENWASPEMWRTEINAGSLNQTEVAKDRKLSVLTTWPLVTDFVSPRITAAHEHLLGFQMNWLWLDYKPSKLEDRSSGVWFLRCVTVENPYGWTSEFCFDRDSGTLVASSSTKKEAPFVCTYLDFQRFGDKLFPTSIQCLKQGRLSLQAKVVELAKLQAINPALFNPPPNARELSYCPHGGTPAKVRTANMMSFHFPDNQGPILITFVVGPDARPHDAMLSRSSGNKAQDDSALNSLKNWGFKAATCDGVAVSSEMQIVVPNIAAHGTDSGAHPGWR